MSILEALFVGFEGVNSLDSMAQVTKLRWDLLKNTGQYVTGVTSLNRLHPTRSLTHARAPVEIWVCYTE